VLYDGAKRLRRGKRCGLCTGAGQVSLRHAIEIRGGIVRVRGRYLV